MTMISASHSNTIVIVEDIRFTVTLKLVYFGYKEKLDNYKQYLTQTLLTYFLSCKTTDQMNLKYMKKMFVPNTDIEMMKRSYVTSGFL